MRRVRIPAALLVIFVALLFQPGYVSRVRADDMPAVEIFADVSRSAGVTHNRLGTVKAIGQAWGDYDNDGWLDLYVTDNDGDLDIYLVNDQFITGIGNVLWRNDGSGCKGWCLTEISEQAGVDQLELDGQQAIVICNAGKDDAIC